MIKLLQEKILFILFISITCFTSISSFAETTIPEVEYMDNSLVGVLPYGKPFKIKGNSVIFNDTIDVVELEITGKNRDKITSKSVWARPINNKENNFVLYVDRKLRFETEYSLKFTFYSKLRFSSQVTKKILNSTLTEMRSYSRRGFNNEDVRQILFRNINQNIGGKPSFGKLEVTPNGVNFQPERTYQLPIDIENNLSLIILYEQRLNSDYEKLEDNQKIFESNKDEIMSILKSKENVNSIQNQVKRINQYFFENKNYYSTINDDINSLSLSNEQRTIIGNTLAATRYIRDYALLSIQKKRKQLDSLNQAVGNIKEIISEGFVRANIAHMERKPEVATSTELDAIMIGTTYGTGLAIFNLITKNDQQNFVTSSAQADAFTYIGLKFFLRPVDKRLPSKLAYLSDSKLAKVSITLGAATSSLNYRGQNMESIGGIKPFAGISYDLTRYITLDAGMILFKQPSLSPENTEKKLRTALIAGISFDANVFNLFKNLFTTNNLNP